MNNVAFIGLGVMGYPMAGHLSKAGKNIAVYNRTASRAEDWLKEYSGIAHDTPAGASQDAEIVFTCVGNDADVRNVIYGDEGALAGMSEGTVLVDHTTASPELAIELAEAAAEKGVDFLDAPVSGGQAGAENGTLAIMVGGEKEAFNKAEAVMDLYARAATIMGPTGSGQLTKAANQIAIAGLVQGLSEALNFASRSGLDGKQVVDVISKGAAGSWQMENRGYTMVDDEFDFGFAVDWMCKDLDIALKVGLDNGSTLPVTALVNQYYREVQSMGGGRWDTSSLIRRLTRIS